MYEQSTKRIIAVAFAAVATTSVPSASRRALTTLFGSEPISALLPGLLFVGALAGLAFAVNRWREVISALVVAVVLGAITANLGVIPTRCRPGLSFAAKKFLRVGVVLLGFRLTLGQIGDLGPKGLGLVVVVVALTFGTTQWIGRRLGLPPTLSLLVATGFSICGASAIAAMRGITPEAEDEDVAYSIALVTICGTLAIFTLPTVGRWLGFQGSTLGSWIGASVHDVAQTVATAAQGDADTKTTAIVVKLTRVVLLAPLVAGMSLWRRRQSAQTEVISTTAAAGSKTAMKRPPIIPLFVAGFLAAIAVRTTGWIPAQTLKNIKAAETTLFAAALVGLGTGVELSKLRRIGSRPLVLGLLSWLLIATVSAVGVNVLDL
jgi:uncharacterized integral membrane protein (TIGR00698 family)